jgi:topoisomerase-4 subunit B
VGVSVTNALSKRMEVTSYRDGKVANLVFQGGDVIESLKVRAANKEDRKSGTLVRVWPDQKYFESGALPLSELMHLLRAKRF